MKIAPIEVADLKSEGDFHELLQTKLNFPDYYGQNLDALFDMLTGWVDLPLCLELVGWSGFEKSIGRERANLILSCFRDADMVTVTLL